MLRAPAAAQRAHRVVRAHQEVRAQRGVDVLAPDLLDAGFFAGGLAEARAAHHVALVIVAGVAVLKTVRAQMLANVVDPLLVGG